MNKLNSLEAIENNIDTENEVDLEIINKIIKGNPDSFFILVGAMRYNPVKNLYESGEFDDVDENSKLSTGTALATGGKDRVIAAAELHKYFPKAYIVPMSRARDVTKPTYAEVAKRELVEKGVDEKVILLEEDSVSTITELKEAIRITLEKRWSGIVFITSNWHIPRSKALLNHIENFADTKEEERYIAQFVSLFTEGSITVQFVGSTEVLLARSSYYVSLFNALQEHSGINKRIAVEEKALESIRKGMYDGRLIPKKIFGDQD